MYFPRANVKKRRAESDRIKERVPSGILALNVTEQNAPSTEKKIKEITDLNDYLSDAKSTISPLPPKRKKIQRIDKGKNKMVFRLSLN